MKPIAEVNLKKAGKRISPFATRGAWLFTLLIAFFLFGMTALVRAEFSPLWISRVPAGTSLGSGPAGIHVDPDGVSYITGIVGSSSVNDIKTVSFAPDGSVRWSQTYDSGKSGDQARGIARGPGNLLYVVGNTPGLPSGIYTVDVATEQSGEHELVLDLEMPKLHGLEAIPLIHQLAPKAEICIFSGFEEGKVAEVRTGVLTVESRRAGQGGAQGGIRIVDLGVGLDEAEHRREARLDHPGALGLGADADAACRQRDVERQRLLERVRRRDRAPERRVAVGGELAPCREHALRHACGAAAHQRRRHLQRLHERVAYARHPYLNSTQGTAASIGKFGEADLFAFNVKNCCSRSGGSYRWSG